MFPGSLQIFHEVAKQGSIRKAAEELGLVPSSVSRQIAILEGQIGTALFDRTSTGVTLTHAGGLVEEFARSVILDYDGLRSDLNDLAGRRRGLIRIATVESIVSSLPILAIERFHETYRDVAFQIEVMPAPSVVSAIKSGTADIGATFCPKPDPDLLPIVRFDEPIVVAFQRDSALSVFDKVSIEQLAACQIAIPALNFQVRSIMNDVFNAAGVRLEPLLSSNNFSALIEFARLGLGVSILPYRSLARHVDIGQIDIRPIDSDKTNSTFIEFFCFKNRRLSLLLKSFNQQIKSISSADKIIFATQS
jgi:DNA-binding transcriptional LysR family regulator